MGARRPEALQFSGVRIAFYMALGGFFYLGTYSYVTSLLHRVSVGR